MTDLERIRYELARLRGEAERLRATLAQRPRRTESRATMEGLAARDLLAAIADALAALGKAFFAQCETTTSDLRALIALCEEDASQAGPLVELETRCFGNAIRGFLADIAAPPLSPAAAGTLVT